MEETRGMSTSLKNRIKALQMQPVDQKTANMRKPQIDLVRTKFMDAINKYQGEEKLYRDKYKERMARQFKIGAYCCWLHDCFLSLMFVYYSESECNRCRGRGGCQRRPERTDLCAGRNGEQVRGLTERVQGSAATS